MDSFHIYCIFILRYISDKTVKTYLEGWTQLSHLSLAAQRSQELTATFIGNLFTKYYVKIVIRADPLI